MVNEKLLKRLNTYLSFVSYELLTKEQLRILEKTGVVGDKEVFNVRLETCELLSKDLVLPLRVRGVFLKEGRPKVKYYTAEEISKSVSNPKNKSFPLMFDHKHKEASMIVGKVDKIWFDKKTTKLHFEAHINDETTARNVLDGVITDVSASIFSKTVTSIRYGIEGVDLVYGELSFVIEGAESSNYVEVVK